MNDPMKYLSGFYSYVVLQLIFLLRFGRLNAFSFLDALVIAIGFVSIVALFTLQDKYPKKNWLLPFFLAVPFSIIGMLFGGLLGVVGILAYGLLPFVVAFAARHSIASA